MSHDRSSTDAPFLRNGVPRAKRLGRISHANFRDFPGAPFDEALTYAALRKAESVGRPVGSREWLTDMERTGLALAPGKRGPKPGSI